MTRAVRLTLFAAGVLAVAGLYAAAVTDIGHPDETYASFVNRATVAERRITDAVTAVNFDFRGFDTLGEEYIMFASVLGVAVLLRRQRDEKEGPPIDRLPGRDVSTASDAVRILSVTLVGPMVLFGIYIVVHGQVTPGGGFQGGVILATAPLLIYLAGEFESLRTLAPRWLVETGEAIGAGGYAVIGASAMLTHAAFLTNWLPLGKPGDVFSGGTVALIDLTVGIEVAAGFVLLLLIFLEETLVRRDPA
jgi:multicomponent Na+:H+ antiporter subunit B